MSSAVDLGGAVAGAETGAAILNKPLKDFLDALPKEKRLTLKDRKQLVAQALILFEQNYAHLPLKVAMHAVNPVQALRLLGGKLDRQTDDPDEPDETKKWMDPEASFHAELITIFNSVRDLHTIYLRQPYYRDWFAYLPFLVEEWFEKAPDEPNGHRSRYIVTNLQREFTAWPEGFALGVAVTHWNGVPIERAVELNAARFAGSNEAARHVRGVEALTLRALQYQLDPDEAWVWVTYLVEDAEGRKEDRTGHFKWCAGNCPEEVVAGQGAAPAGQGAVQGMLARGLDEGGDLIARARMRLFAPEEGSTPADGTSFIEVATRWRKNFRAREMQVDGVTLGHLRIFSFQTETKYGYPDANTLVAEFRRLIRQLPQEGLIVDLRGNGGGNIQAAERMLQYLTSRRIEPEGAQFINTPLNSRICEQLQLGVWFRSMEQALGTGAHFSGAFPLTDGDQANDLGRQYFGPVVLIIDARTYSAADIFAAGFQDHAIGTVLGVDENTGAGGANVWGWDMFLMALPEGSPGSPYTVLPQLTGMNVAMRRTLRGGSWAGTPVEDLGVRRDDRHWMTEGDLLRNNADLLKKAGEILTKAREEQQRNRAWPTLTVAPDPPTNGRITVTFNVPGVRTAKMPVFVEGQVEERVVDEARVNEGQVVMSLEGVPARARVRVEGYDQENKLQAAWVREVGGAG